VGAEYNIPGGVGGGAGNENEEKRALVSRMCGMSSRPDKLGYLLGGGTRKGRGVAVPEEMTDSGADSTICGRSAGVMDSWGGGCRKSLLLMKEVRRDPTPPTRRPTMEAQARNT